MNCQDDQIRWQLLVRDLVSGWYFLRRRELSLREFLRTVIDPRKKDYAILSSRDPRTAIAYPVNSIWKYWKHLAKR